MERGMFAGPFECSACGQTHSKGCRSHKKSGEPCEKSPVRGLTVCASHGGAGRHAKAAGRRRMTAEALERAVERFGLPRTVDPASAIVEALHKAAGRLDFFEAEVRELASPWVEQIGPGGSVRLEEHPAVTADRQALVAYFGFAERIVKLGLAERQVVVAEAEALLLARVVMSLLDDPEFGLSREQRELGRRLAGRHLRQLGSGGAAA